MRGRRDGRDDAEWRVFLQRDAMITAATVRIEPLDTRDELDDFELLDFVVEAADFGFVQLDLAPRLGVGFGHGLDDLNDLGASGYAAFAELQKTFVRGGASFVGILKHAVFATAQARANTSAANAGSGVAAAICFGGRGTGRADGTVQTAQYFSHHVPN